MDKEVRRLFTLYFENCVMDTSLLLDDKLDERSLSELLEKDRLESECSDVTFTRIADVASYQDNKDIDISCYRQYNTKNGRTVKEEGFLVICGRNLLHSSVEITEIKTL